MRVTRRAAAAGAIVLAIASGSAARASAQTTLQASPALGGIAKAGRWLAVRVTINHSGRDLPAELRLTWGHDELRRHIGPLSAGKREYELFIRSREAESTVRVRLLAEGRELQSLDVKLIVLRPDEPVTLCIASTGAGPPPETSCSALVPANRLPRSLRGYDVADRVVWPEGQGSGALSLDQRLAYGQWEVVTRLDRTGDFGFTPEPVRPALDRGLPARTAGITATFAAALLVALLLAGMISVRRRIPLGRLFATIGAVTAVGIAGAHAIGRIGPASAVRLHHQSLLRQLPGTRGALLTVQAVVELPAFDRFTIRAPVSDGVLETSIPGGRSAVIDAEGYPVLTGTFGLGGRQAFSLEGVTDAQWLSVALDGGTIRATNTSDVELRNCRFAENAFPSGPFVLKPSDSVSARLVGELAGPVLTCLVSGSLIPMVESRREVRSNGQTVLVAYLTDSRAVDAASEPSERAARSTDHD
jgi:hypothetical protein